MGGPLITLMKVIAQRQLSFCENRKIFRTICRDYASEKSTKFELVFCLQSMNYDADDALDVEILSCNND